MTNPILCEVCNQPINDPQWGMIKFHRDEDGGFHDPLVCHKISCDDRKDGYLTWGELAWAIEGYQNYASLLDAKLSKRGVIAWTISELKSPKLRST